jgi:4a-hydroxytetrahydrobiopterin dehydratase
MIVYSEEEIREKLATMSGWSLDNSEITKTFESKSFNRAIGFVVQVGILADVADHHPDIGVKYNKTTIRLSTHSENGITDKDFALASNIDQAFGE